MKRARSRWWWLVAVAPAVVLMDVSTDFMTRTGHIPQPLWISTGIVLAVSLMLLAIMISRQHDSAVPGEERRKSLADPPD